MKPPPTPCSSTVSPFFTRPSRTATSSANGTEAADHDRGRKLVAVVGERPQRGLGTGQHWRAVAPGERTNVSREHCGLADRVGHDLDGLGRARDGAHRVSPRDRGDRGVTAHVHAAQQCEASRVF